jgi:hypothetical protein
VQKFIYTLTVLDTVESVIQKKLVSAFPELAWTDGEGNFGKIFLAGESRETPPQITISLLCKEPPDPFVVTILLRNAEAEPDALKARLARALLQ